MAVTPKKIEERLLAKYPKASNLSKARKANITASLAKIPADDADDAAIDAVIEQYNEAINFEELARQDDSLRTMKAKLDAQEPPKPPKPNEDPKPTDPANPMEELVKGLMGKLETITTELSEIKQGKVIETKTEQAKKLFASSEILKKLPERVQNRYLKTLDLNNDELTLEDQIAELEEENEDFIQNLVDQTDLAGAPPIDTGGGKMSEAEIDAIISSADR